MIKRLSFLFLVRNFSIEKLINTDQLIDSKELAGILIITTDFFTGSHAAIHMSSDHEKYIRRCGDEQNEEGGETIGGEKFIGENRFERSIRGIWNRRNARES